MKRFISILLAAMLVISMLPTAFANSTTTYEYIFKTSSMTGISYAAANPTPAEMIAWTGYPTMGNGSQPWKLVAIGSRASGNITDGTGGRLMINQKAAETLNSDNVWAIIKIDVPTAGIYNFDV